MIDAKDLRIFGVVYKITNKITGKIYIGATTQGIRKRWNSHKHSAIRGGKGNKIYEEMKNLGCDNFEIGIIKTCFNEEQLFNSEKYFIKLFRSKCPEFGYNNSIGGKVSSLGKTLSEETRFKISACQKGRSRKPHKQSTIEVIRQKGTGRDMTKACQASVKVRQGKPSHNRIMIFQYSKNGEMLNKFESMTEAAICIGGHISAFGALRIGRLKTYKNL